MTNRFAAIDGLRGLAILMVTAYHLWGYAGKLEVMIGAVDLAPIFSYGYLGVELFFALSGFCLFNPIVKAMVRNEKPPSWL